MFTDALKFFIVSRLCSPGFWRVRSRLDGVLHRDNIADVAVRRIRGTLAVAVLLSIVFVRPVIGQSETSTIATIEAPFLDWTHAERAYGLLERWVELGNVPRLNVPKINVTGVIGVKITMRNAGYTLGVGEAYREDLDAALDRPGPAINLVPLLQQATREALQAVDQSLRDAELRSIMEGRIEAGAGKPDRRQYHQLVLIDLQIAHKLESVRILADAPPDAVYGKFAPDFHGLRLLAPNAEHPLGSIIWPASALAANMQPGSQLRGLLVKQGYNAQAIPQIARPKGPILHRFEVIHYVRPRFDERIVRLVRGNVMIDPQTINTTRLADMADTLFAHLSRRFTSTGLRGTYHPTSNRYEPALADDEQLALASYAVARYYRFMSQHEADEPAINAAEVAHQAALKLAQTSVTPDAKVKPAVVALALLTLSDSLVPRGGAELREQLGRLLLELRDPDGGFLSSGDDGAKPVTQAEAALIAASLATLYQQTLDPEIGTAVSGTLDHLWTSIETNPQALSLYWFALAHERSAKLIAARSEKAAESVLTRMRGLAMLTNLLSEQQVIEPPLLGPDDVLGGFELYPGPPGSPPSPNCTSASLLAFLAITMRDDEMAADQDTFGWLLTASLTARFIAQLMMDKPSCYYVRSVEDSLGGVRLSLWDNRLKNWPTALSLLAMVELQESIQALETRAAP